MTQALWVAVMGENPSGFIGEQAGDLLRPVEQVSWDDCQDFLGRLNAVEAALAARLPIEAEWERACRGETLGATWVGGLSEEKTARKLDAIAWYEGNRGECLHDAEHCVGEITTSGPALDRAPCTSTGAAGDRGARAWGARRCTRADPGEIAA